MPNLTLRVISAGLGGLLTIFLLASCRFPQNDEEWNRRFDAAVAARKTGNSKFWTKRQFPAGTGFEPAVKYGGRRAVLLLDRVEVVSTKSSDGERSRFSLRPTGEKVGLGSATVISADGYILTAAHCVDQSPLTLCIRNANGKRVFQKTFRVVWKGDPDNGGPDLALLKIPPRDLLFFPLSKPDANRKKSEIASVGFGMLFTKQSEVGMQNSGKILYMGEWRTRSEGVRWRRVFHSAPLVSGDSGGPVMDRDGKLAGINFAAQAILIPGIFRDYVWQYAAIAVQPDLDWIQSLIEKDRARHRR